MADLAGARAKLRRADEHRLAFDELFIQHMLSEPYSIELEFDPGTGWHIFRWRVAEEPPLEDLALIFGDILGNLRAALDYAVWQLVLAGGERPGRKTSFPVVRRARDWPVQGSAALKGVPDEYAALIEEIQPFHSDRPDDHPLMLLEELNNVNKHRFLPVGVLTADDFSYLIGMAPLPEGEMFEHKESLDAPVVDGEELARFRSASRREIPVQVTEHPRFRPSFSDGRDIGWTAVTLVEWVREVLAQLESAFLP